MAPISRRFGGRRRDGICCPGWLRLGGMPPRVYGPFEFTVTGGSGKYGWPSGRLSYTSRVSA
jgi:hypothetical protein